MESIMEVCFMCTKDLNCVPVDKKIISQVEYLLPEIKVVKLGIPLRICSFCEVNLNSFNTFKQIWVENSNKLEAKIKASQNTTTHAQKSSQIQTEQNVNDNVEIVIKEEEFDNNDISDKHVEENAATDQDENSMTAIEFLEIEESLDNKTDNDDSTSEPVEPSDPKFEEVYITENILEENDIYKDLPGTSTQGVTTIPCPGDALMPKKSELIYKKEYQNFSDWRTKNNIINITEDTVLAYYKMMSETKKASSMWTSYSMLRSCLAIYKNIDISKFVKVTTFLKRASKNYQPKKSKILDSADVIKFINDAHDDIFLAMKVILIIGYCGACRRDELTKMRVSDVDIKSDTITVNVPRTKTSVSRFFVIKEASWVALIKRYVEMRPTHVTHNRFFITYRNGRCVTSPIGINTIGVVPRNIAKYLKLPNPELYTGQCFRRSSASHLANLGVDLVTIKKHGGWKSSIGEEFSDTSLRNKVDVAQYTYR